VATSTSAYFNSLSVAPCLALRVRRPMLISSSTS
jgi:hypothetical protein